MSNYTNENASQNMKGNVLHIRNESVSHDRLSHDRNANASHNMKGNVSHNLNENVSYETNSPGRSSEHGTGPLE